MTAEGEVKYDTIRTDGVAPQDVSSCGEPTASSAWESGQVAFADTVSRPSSPVYPQISEVLQTMISSLLAGQSAPSAALSSARSQIQQIPGYTA